MPTYEYHCDACGHDFEEFQSIMAKPIRICPKCGKAKVRRLIGTGAGMIFKGSGFYITDYRPESYKEAAKAEQGGGEAKKDGKAGESKAGESKPAEGKPTAAKPAAEAAKPAASNSPKASKKAK